MEIAKGEIAALINKARRLEEDSKTRGGRSASSAIGQATTARREAQGVLDRYLKRLTDFRVLDPACGSGNFLYIALRELKELELRTQVEAETLGLPRGFPSIGPEVVRGIELNPYAAELARVSVWIGEIQWSLRNGFPPPSNPVLKPLDTIECRDALVTLKATNGVTEYAWEEAAWPPADAIVGNPPFLGGKIMRSELGDAAVERLFRLYKGRVPAEADLVVYWLEKAAAAIMRDRTSRAGLVTTNSVRGGANRVVMDRIADEIGFVSAWSDEPWTVEGAAVRVSMVTFGRSYSGELPHLNGQPVACINSNLTATAIDLTKARPLAENTGVAFQGITRGAPFDVDALVARAWLAAPLNPNGKPNAEVLVQMKSGGDIVKRRDARWVIDFTGMTEVDAALFQDPFEYVRQVVKPVRDANRRERYRSLWWLFSETRTGLRKSVKPLKRFIVTPKVSRHRVFVWFTPGEIGDNLEQVFRTRSRFSGDGWAGS